VSIRFPGESREYRAARDRLLDQEVELRRSMEAVAAARRELPPGGPVPEDYVFKTAGGDGSPTAMRLHQAGPARRRVAPMWRGSPPAFGASERAPAAPPASAPSIARRTAPIRAKRQSPRSKEAQGQSARSRDLRPARGPPRL
jgi:Bacterial protein of unknown function (DUF899)